jgi:hypothetical protein
MRATHLIAVANLVMGAAALGVSAQTSTVSPQTPLAHIVFDVVSVKPNHTETSHPGSMIRSDGFDAENQTPLSVMYWVFDCGLDRDERNFSGLPAWGKSERFDIIAKVADGDVPAWKKLPNRRRNAWLGRFWRIGSSCHFIVSPLISLSMLW